jgi:hypothetical protein
VPEFGIGAVEVNVQFGRAAEGREDILHVIGVNGIHEIEFDSSVDIRGRDVIFLHEIVQSVPARPVRGEVVSRA